MSLLTIFLSCLVTVDSDIKGDCFPVDSQIVYASVFVKNKQ